MAAIQRRFFDRDAVEVARDLIGATLMVNGVGGIIVETEAYKPEDAASHSYRGQTPGNAAMFGPPGTAYVYRSYGIHWCLNAVCSVGSAVLLRALEPTAGLSEMADRRGMAAPALLCSGPGRLTQALAVDGMLNNRSLLAPPFRLRMNDRHQNLIVGPRIGITKAVELPWRFGLGGSPFLSKRFPATNIAT